MKANAVTAEAVYEKKQQWLDRIMASGLNNAQKIFAYSIFKHCYGVKVSSYPDTKDILEDTGGKSAGHFTSYRKALVACGAITADLGYHTKSAKQKNYVYTLNLDWDGSCHATTGGTETESTCGTTTGATDNLIQTTPGAMADSSGTTSGDCRTTSGDFRSTYGDCRTTTGGSNTTNNPSNRTASKTTTDVPPATPVAHDPSPNLEVKERVSSEAVPSDLPNLHVAGTTSSNPKEAGPRETTSGGTAGSSRYLDACTYKGQVYSNPEAAAAAKKQDEDYAAWQAMDDQAEDEDVEVVW